MKKECRAAFGKTLLSLLVLCFPALPQIKISYGEIAGSIADPGGRRITAATVAVSDSARGVRRVSSVDVLGEYRVSLLPPGRYTVEFQAGGFTPVVVEGVDVRVGETVELNPQMAIRDAATSITIEAQSQVIEPRRVQQASWLEAERIASLPINRRNYLDFALLAPGLVETNRVADGTDYRIPSTPHSGIGIAGGNGSGNTFSIDGFSNSGITGNMRPSVPQVGVQEFQINRNSYSAEYGGGYAGAINIVTRSGSDDTHAEVFGYFRHRDIQARNFFDPAKSAFTRVQSGASAGGALKKGRVYWFAALEGLNRHESVFVPLLNDPGTLSRLTASQQQLLGFLDRSGVPQLQGLSAAMRGALTPTANPLVQPLFASNSGVFPFSASGVQGQVRLDYRPSERNSLFFRTNFTFDTEENTKLGAQNAYSRGSSLEDTDTTQALGFTHIFNPRWFAETRLSFGYNRFAGKPNDPNGPAVDIAGYGNFGRDPQFPADTRTRYLQFQQYFTCIRSRHALKFGTDLNPARNAVAPQVYMGGRFIFGSFIPLAQLLNTYAGSPDFAAGLAGNLAAFGQPGLARNLIDPITSLQAFALGLPVYYIQAFGNPSFKGWQQHYSGFIEDGWRPTSNLMLSLGLRYQHESTEGLPGRNTFSPRVGFAWSPQEGRKMVIRGGYGLLQAYSDFQVPYSAWSAKGPELTYAFIPITGISVLNPRTRQPLNSADIFQTLFAQGVLGQRPIQFQDLAQFGIPSGFRFPNQGGLAASFVNPYSHQASLEVERSIAGFGASIAYNFSRTLHLPRIRDINLYQAAKRPDGWPAFGRVDPMLDFNHRVESAANASYNAMIAQLSRRLSNRWMVQAHYTFSKAIDEVIDLTPDYTPHNQLDARGDRALSSFNQSHRFVANAVYQSSPDARAWYAKDWTLSFATVASSGQPFNVVTATDNLGDGKVTNHRPLGLGRNVGKGPSLFTADFRVARTVRLQRESDLRLQLTAEVFNALNRTNFESVNNGVGDIPLQSLPSPITGRRGDPSVPFSFISARDPRQFQFGLRFAF